jgi:hypothetical protein
MEEARAEALADVEPKKKLTICLFLRSAFAHTASITSIER